MNQAPLLICLFFLLPFTPAFAQADAKNDLLSLSLRELLTIRVVSQKAESVRVAPGIVSTYSSDELRTLGLKNLKDFLDFVPGVQVNPSAVGVSVVSIRGLWDAHAQKILLLIDGVPTWSSAYADIPLLGIPLSAIDRIEVMRGPSAVIYGTNASAGVINIVTNKQAKAVEVSVSELGYLNAGVAAAFDWQNDAKMTFALEYQDEDGFESDVQNAFTAFDPGCMCFPSNASGSITYYESKLAANSNVQWRGFETALLLYNTTVSGSADGSLLAPYERIETGKQIAVNYKQQTQNGFWKVFSDWENSYSKSEITDINATLGLPGDGEVSFDNHGKDNIRWRTGAQYQFSIHDKLKLLSGAEYERRSTENSRFINYEGLESIENLGFNVQPDGSILLVEEGEYNEKAVYAEFNVDLAQVDLRVGARHVINSHYGDKTLPRVSAVYHFLPKQSLKYMYAVGFNSPTFLQIAATDAFGLPVEQDLDAELIQSHDLAYTYSTGTHHFVLNAFALKLKDGIIQQAGRFVNSRSLKRKGFELDYQYHKDDFVLLVGGSYFMGLDREEALVDRQDTLAPFTPLWQTDVGGRYKIGHHTIGMSLRSSGARASVDAYYWLNANYELSLGHCLLSVNIENLLGDDLYFPDVLSGNDVVRQAAEKQRFSFKIKYVL